MPGGDMVASCFTQPSPAEKSYAGKRDHMRGMLLAIAFVFVWVSLERPDTRDPMETVRQHVDYSNKGDVKAMAATCAVSASILDGLAPHVCQGPTACEE